MVEMSDDSEAEQRQVDFLHVATSILRTLGHPVRLQIVNYLVDGEKSVGEIQNYLGISQPLTSQHLTKMFDRGILVCRIDGVRRYYSVTSPFIHKLLNCFSECSAKVVSGEWAFLIDVFQEGGFDDRNRSK